MQEHATIVSPDSKRSPVSDSSPAERLIAVVDDDPLFRESLERNLLDAGFQVRGFESAEDVVDHLSEFDGVALILLDWKMPGMTGIQLLRHLRDAGYETPVIFLTVLSDQIYEEAALIGGAVDFVEKSRSFAILLRRIELALAGLRSDPAPADGTPASRRIGSLEFASDTARAHWNGSFVDLTLSEFNIVRYLAERSGQDVRYRELYDLVRGRDFVAGKGIEGYRSNVRTFIKRIRHKFRAIDPRFDSIENYPGFGYRWRADDADTPN